MNVIWAQVKEAREKDTRGERACLPRALCSFIAPIFHAIQSNVLVIVDHFKVYAFSVLKAIKYSCSINFTFSAHKVAIVKLRAHFGNQHISLLASSLFMVRTRAAERRRFAGWKWKFVRDRCKLSLSFPAPRTLPRVPENFSSAVSGLNQVFLAASAYHRRCVGLRPTTKISAAREKKKSGTQDTRTRVSFCVLVSRDLSRLPQIMGACSQATWAPANYQ